MARLWITNRTLSGKSFQQVRYAYGQSVSIDTPSGAKTNVPAAEFYNQFAVAKARGVNLRLLDAAPGLMVGAGLLGTFWGLTQGISGFDSSTSDMILGSIQGLLGGMGTAFTTSLAGMCASLFLTLCDKFVRHRLARVLHDVTERLDAENYIDDTALLCLKVTAQLRERLSYANSDGTRTDISSAVRDILTENREQTQALKSFSTDLAIELNNRFDEVLSRQMQQKILPLMENIDKTTHGVIEHIDMMKAEMSAPATDMIQAVVDELKTSMSAIMGEFSKGLSSTAGSELERLAAQLGTAAGAMADFPNNMAEISATLKVTIEEVQSAIFEISSTAASNNTAAMQRMQEQIAMATGAMSNAIGEMKDVMGSVVQQVRQSVVGITQEVNASQINLIAMQGDATQQTQRLLDAFNDALERMRKMNDAINGTMNMLQQAQGQITGSTAHLQTITGDMKLATQLFGNSQANFTDRMETLQTNTQQSIDGVTKLVGQSGQMHKDYAAQFEVIKQGLSVIFAQLTDGMKEYSKTVAATTQQYLDQYSTSLTQTTSALSSNIQQLSEVAEMLTESVTSKR